MVALGEPEYPPWLAVTDGAPPLLYVKGDVALVDRPMVAIVGARNGSAIGQKFTRMIASDLGREGFVIVSGLARGIDTAAHTAALERGKIAVLAGGIYSIYPPENAELHAAIGERGVLLSEMPPCYRPRGQDFPRRNRIISGVFPWALSLSKPRNGQVRSLRPGLPASKGARCSPCPAIHWIRVPLAPTSSLAMARASYRRRKL